jgi:hypothetical protein
VRTDAAGALPPLRTNSVNRGFCISLFTLEIVVLASTCFFCHGHLDAVHVRSLFSRAYNAVSTEDEQIRHLGDPFRRAALFSGHQHLQ